jgi:hypothetical protein
MLYNSSLSKTEYFLAHLKLLRMRTVIGLFQDSAQAEKALSDLKAAGVHSDALDQLTADDVSDAPKLRVLGDLLPEPDLGLYLEAIRRGGTLVTAQVRDDAASRAAEILGNHDLVNLRAHAAKLACENPSIKAELTHNAELLNALPSLPIERASILEALAESRAER